MPKIFVLRHQLAEQQAKLKLQAKGGSDPSGGSVSPGSDDDKFETQSPTSGHVTCIVNPASPPQVASAAEHPLELISRQQKITGRPTLRAFINDVTLYFLYGLLYSHKIL